MFSILLMLIPINNVLAFSINYHQTFEEQINGNQISIVLDPNHLMYSQKKSGGNFYVSSADKHSGGLSFLVGTSCIGYWNLSYSKLNYLTNFSLWFKLSSGNVGYDESLYFYNKTNCLYTNPIIEMSFGTGGYIYYYENFIVKTLSSGYSSGWMEYSFNIESVTGECSYYYYGLAHKDGYVNNASQINSGYRIDALAIVSNANILTLYHDDLNLTISDAYGGTTSGCSDFTGYVPTGRFGYGGTDVDSVHISTKFNVPVSTTIKGIELQISENQYLADSTLSNYGCSINGVSLGNPVCIFAESYYYVVQWTCTVAITNQIINFDFSHTQLISGTQYWDVGCGVSSTDDTNGDSDVGFYWQDDSVVYHWEWILGIPFFVPTYGAGTTLFARDLGMRFWSTGFASPQTFNFNNTLGLANYYSYNTTGYIYDLSKGYENVMGAYTLGSGSLAYTLNLYVNGTLSHDYGFPIKCRYPGSGFGFAPETIGKYRMQLNSTHALKNVTAWVIGTRPIYSITTNPVISDQYLSYSVTTRYNNPQGYTGGVAMDNYKQMLNQFFTCMFQKYPIQNNETKSFAHQTNSSIVEYWGLYTNVNGLYNKVADATHFIRIPSIYENELHTARNNYPCPINNVDSLSIPIEGTHMFPGGDVRLYANTIYIASVGDNQNIMQGFQPKKFGAFNITMYLVQNGTTVFLARCNFTVSPSDLPGTETGENQIVSFIPKQYYIFIAIAIIIGFAFMPFAIIYTILSQLKTKTGIELHIPSTVMMVLSIITSIVGFILDILWGLLPWWSVFLLLFVLILIFGIFYYSRKNEAQT